MMPEVARALHVVAVVLWIGGVGMVTTVLLPEVRRAHEPAARFARFHALERRFARQARWTVALAGLSGFYMVWRYDLWDRFRSADFWWMHAMLATWLVFALMLFVIEPLFLDRAMARWSATRPQAAWRAVEALHGFLLALGLIAIAGAVAGSHGVNLLAW